jgi:hypothetical protein
VNAKLRVYGDTNTLPSNADDACPAELSALKELWDDKRLKWYGSHLVDYEAGRTKEQSKRDRLVAEHERRERISKDEKVVGGNVQYLSNPYGGFFFHFLLSDVQDEPLREELVAQRFRRKDAEHIAQAVSNSCDVFLTLDRKTILTAKRRAWLKERFSDMEVLLPSELVAKLEAGILPRPK